MRQTPEPGHLVINLGQSLQEQRENVQSIKDAMARAMILCWECSQADPGSNTFAQASLIYLEAEQKALQLNQGWNLARLFFLWCSARPATPGFYFALFPRSGTNILRHAKRGDLIKPFPLFWSSNNSADLRNRVSRCSRSLSPSPYRKLKLQKSVLALIFLYDFLYRFLSLWNKRKKWTVNFWKANTLKSN